MHQKLDKKFQFILEKHILNRLLELIKSVKKDTWMNSAEIIYPYSKDKDKKQGLRFYVLLTELLRSFSISYPKNDDGTDSVFKTEY